MRFLYEMLMRIIGGTSSGNSLLKSRGSKTVIPGSAFESLLALSLCISCRIREDPSSARGFGFEQAPAAFSFYNSSILLPSSALRHNLATDFVRSSFGASTVLARAISPTPILCSSSLAILRDPPLSLISCHNSRICGGAPQGPHRR